MEPFYIRQTAEPMLDDERRSWVQQCADEAKAQGAVMCRASIHPDHGWTLVEAWRTRPDDQGEIRWQIAAVGIS